MEFQKIEKAYSGKFLEYYNVTYLDRDGHEKVYEMVSRDRSLHDDVSLHDRPTDAVVMILTDPRNEHILLVKEFRCEAGKAIYGLPAGLIDPGETAEECAARELKEETGLDLIHVEDVLKGAFCAVGLSNETTSCVLGVADGQLQHFDTEGEEIDANWYTKDEVRRMIREEHFGSWAQAYCYMWSKA